MTGSKRGRTHDAQGARDAILDAAEKIFAEHGFDGARVDAIAAEASYNKSLIFQYFGDKLGLYAAVIRRMDEHARGLQAQALDVLRTDETFANPETLKSLLRTYLRAYFDYLIAHPNLRKIFLWEMAEDWATYKKILTPDDFEDMARFKPFLDKIGSAGLLRSDFPVMAQLLMVDFMYPSYLACLPLYQTLIPGDDLTSTVMLERARDFIIEFVVHGMFADN